MKKFHSVFSPRVKSLDATQYAPDTLEELMDDALVKSIYKNVKANADRYWARIWLVHRLYHDEKLCDAANSAQHYRTLGYTHARESMVDSAIVSLTRGFLDLGNDSLSLVRLFPSSSDYIRKNKPQRLKEEEEACSLLYQSWYEGHPTDGNFIQVWSRLTEALNAFRKADQVKRVLDMRNKIVAHSLDKALGEPMWSKNSSVLRYQHLGI